MRTLSAEDTARKEIPLSEVLPEPAGGVDTGVRVQEPPSKIAICLNFTLAPEIRFVVVVPDFKVSTADARNVLPSHYPAQDQVRMYSLEV